MKDLEKIFADKLRNHQTPPPAGSWDKLSGALDKNHNSKKLVYWRVAAAVALLLGLSFWWVIPQEQRTNLADETPHKEQSAPVEQPTEAAEQHGQTKEKQPNEEETVKPDEGRKPATKPKTAKKNSFSRPQQEPRPVLAQADAQPDLDKPSQIPVLEVISAEKLLIANEETLMAELPVIKVGEPVTIIFKPGESTSVNDAILAENSQQSPLDILNEIKNAGISFSEIRNAKSELLAKVFTRKESEDNR